MKESFLEWNPRPESRNLLGYVDLVLSEYDRQGYQLTLRQLFYQLVARDLIPNTDQEYNKLGNVVKRGRLAGYVDWDIIEDRMRIPQKNGHWKNPQQIIKAAANSYYLSRWENQSNYIEVWCEKDAVSNIIQPICAQWDVLFLANRGYSSETAMYDAFQRFSEQIQDRERRGRDVDQIRILYLGDHDPSGINMVNDIKNRMGNFFFKKKNSLADIVDRIALKMDQIKQYDPPENPAKITDPRFQDYRKTYGKSSWELDALEPKILAGIVEDAIMQFIDLDEYKRVEAVEEEQKMELNELAEKFDE